MSVTKRGPTMIRNLDVTVEYDGETWLLRTHVEYWDITVHEISEKQARALLMASDSKDERGNDLGSETARAYRQIEVEIGRRG